MKSKFTFSILLLWTSLLGAQDLLDSPRASEWAYIFRLTEGQAKQFHRQKGYPDLEAPYFDRLVDSFRAAEEYTGQLAPGHYLQVRTQGGGLYFLLTQVYPYELDLLRNNTDLCVQVRDRTTGRIVEDARLDIRGKSLRYDPLTQTYRHRKSNRRGYLRLRRNGDTAYFSIDRYLNNPRWRRTTKQVLYRTPLRYVWRPLRYVVALPIAAIRSAQRGYSWGEVERTKRFFRRLACWVHQDNCDYYGKKYRGYVISNKPKYRPGDSLHLKAFVVDKKGRPYRKPLWLKLPWGKRDSDRIALEPYRPGGYVYATTWNDSLDLRLDQNYKFTLEDHKGRYVNFIYLRYEDYELRKLRLEVRSESPDSTQDRGTPFQLWAQGRDDNDLPLYDASLELSLRSQSVEQYWADSVFIPDTLYHTILPLLIDGDTPISIPDSIFPPVNMRYLAEVTLRTSDQEQRRVEKRVGYFHRRAHFDFELRGDSVRLAYRENGVEKPVSAQLSEIDARGRRLRQRTCELPRWEKLDADWARLELECEGLEKVYDLSQEADLVNCYARRSRDSLHVTIDNPRSLGLVYFLYQGNREIARGHGDSLVLHRSFRTGQRATLSISYRWAGEMRSTSYQAEWRTGALQVALIQPTTVYPGQEGDIEVRVTNAEGDPVADVDLSVFGLTKKFNYSAPKVPQLGKRSPPKMYLNNFKELELTGSEHRQALSYADWRARARLDEMPYYNFLYPGDSLYTYHYATPDSSTQFAPFVLRRGQVRTLYLIYVDQRPVYFAWSDNLQPYSFPISPGRHQIELRTFDRSILLPKVDFPAGQKTILALDQDQYRGADIQKSKRPYQLSDDEQQRVRPYLFSFTHDFRNRFAYLQQGDRFYSLERDPKRRMPPGLLGPLEERSLTIRVPGLDTLRLSREAGYRYYLERDFVQATEARRFQSSFQSLTPQTSFTDLSFNRATIEGRWRRYREDLRRRLALSPRYANAGATGDLIVERPPGDSLPLNVILFAESSQRIEYVYPGQQNEYGQLAPGIYQLIFLYPNAGYRRVDGLRVRAGGNNYYQLRDWEAIRRDSFGQGIEALIEAQLLRSREGTQGEEYLIQLGRIYHEAFSRYEGPGPLLRGRVRSGEGDPLYGAIIRVADRALGTVTNLEGYYAMRVPPGTSHLVVSYLGYEDQRVALEEAGLAEITLRPAVGLSQITVRDRSTSGGVVTGAQIRALPTRNISALAAQVAGIQMVDGGDDIVVRGSRAGETYYYIDGIRISGSADLPQSENVLVSVLEGEAAQALSGEAHVQRVVLLQTVVPTEVDPDFMAAAGSSRSLRQHFSDDAFWQPQLRTDAEGRARFTVTFPDDVTTWETHVLAMNGRQQSGQSRGQIRSFKPLLAQLATPRFLVRGDTAQVVGKVTNYRRDSMRIQTQFSRAGTVLAEKESWCTDVQLDTLRVATTAADTLLLQYRLENAKGYFDGEQRALPQLPRGMERSEGDFYRLDRDTTIQLQLPQDTVGRYRLRALAGGLDILEGEIKRIKRYPYHCNEQLASRILAYLAQWKINRARGIDQRDRAVIQKLIRRLERNRLPGGLWGWWGRGQANDWISLHVLEALAAAKAAGWKVKALDGETLLQQRLTLDRTTDYRKQLRRLQILRQLGVTVDFSYYLEQLKLPEEAPLYHRLQQMELAADCGLPWSRDSLDAYRRETLSGSVYFDDDGRDRSLFYDPIATTLLAYQLLRRDSTSVGTDLRPIQNYFFENRPTGYWRNTYEAARIIATLLEDLLADDPLDPPELRISADATFGSREFPVDLSLSAGGQYTLLKTGRAPLYLGVYQSYWDQEAQAQSGDFAIRSWLAQRDSNVVLRAGQPTELVVEVEVLKKADYVQVEIPIPAACTYASKSQGSGVEVHREHYRDRTAIFCRSLSPGTYRFVVELLPRYSGQYTCNPATVELMYFPTFSANTSIKKIKVD